MPKRQPHLQLAARLVSSSRLRPTSTFRRLSYSSTSRGFPTAASSPLGQQRRQQQQHLRAPSHTTRALALAPVLPPHQQHQHQHLSRTIHTTPALAMSSDDDAYAAFLEKANRDVSGAGEASAAGQQQSSGESKRIRIQAVPGREVEVPPALRGIDEVYVSESDEGFEGVGVVVEGGVLGVESLRKALRLTPETRVEEVSERDFDPRGEYASVLERVKGAGDGTVRVFRIELDEARTEIWILSLGVGGREAVGVRALSVET